MWLLKGEGVLLTTFWFFNSQIILLMGITIFQVVLCCWWYTVEVAIGIHSFFFFWSFIAEGCFDSLGKVFNCLMLFVFIFVILNAHLSFFGFLKYSLRRKLMFKIYGAFGLVTIECFFYSFLVRFILVSNKSFLNFVIFFFVMLAIEIGFAFIYFDGINVYTVH